MVPKRLLSGSSVLPTSANCQLFHYRFIDFPFFHVVRVMRTIFSVHHVHFVGASVARLWHFLNCQHCGRFVECPHFAVYCLRSIAEWQKASKDRREAGAQPSPTFSPGAAEGCPYFAVYCLRSAAEGQKASKDRREAGAQPSPTFSPGAAEGCPYFAVYCLRSGAEGRGANKDRIEAGGEARAYLFSWGGRRLPILCGLLPAERSGVAEGQQRQTRGGGTALAYLTKM